MNVTAVFGKPFKNDIYDALCNAKKDSGLSFAQFLAAVLEVLAWFTEQYGDD